LKGVISVFSQERKSLVGWSGQFNLAKILSLLLVPINVTSTKRKVIGTLLAPLWKQYILNILTLHFFPMVYKFNHEHRIIDILVEVDGQVLQKK
jgi:hypothetical protein